MKGTDGDLQSKENQLILIETKKTNKQQFKTKKEIY